MINIDIGKIENLYYRLIILMRYFKVLYKMMLRGEKKRVKFIIVGGLLKYYYGK